MDPEPLAPTRALAGPVALAVPGGATLADALAALSPEEGVRWAGPPLAV